MVYGVAIVHDTNNYSKMEIVIQRNENANLLINKGCNAVFTTEGLACSYAYEQSEMSNSNIEFNRHIYDVE